MVVEGGTVVLPLAGVIDIAEERKRLSREVEKLDGEIKNLDGRLANTAFRTKAAPEAVEKLEDRRASAVETRARLTEALASIAG
jgi:valyl-tRNA synthetase